MNESAKSRSAKDYKDTAQVSPTDMLQTRRIRLNTLILTLIFVALCTVSTYAYTQFKYISEAEAAQLEINKQIDAKKSEIAHLVMDEGYKKCVYKDSRKYPTIGFGHLIKPDEKFKCITPKQAVQLLREDYNKAEASVDKEYYWAYGEVRLVLINMTYQMGSTGVSNFKQTLEHLQDEKYDEAASELLDSAWASQTPSRAAKMAGRIMALEVTHNQ